MTRPTSSPWDSFPTPREAFRWGLLGAVFTIAILGALAAGAADGDGHPSEPVQVARP